MSSCFRSCGKCVPSCKAALHVLGQLGVVTPCYARLLSPVRRCYGRENKLILSLPPAPEPLDASPAELRPDLVKLDWGLIRDLQGDDPRLPLVTALVRYAHDLGIRVVAEGIETEAELRTVAELGVDCGQGYFLERPAASLTGLSREAAALWPGLTR